MKILLFCISLILSQTVLSAEITIFGVTIRGNLPLLPICENDYDVKETCFKGGEDWKKQQEASVEGKEFTRQPNVLNMKSNGNDFGHNYEILLPSSEVPSYLKHERLIGDFTISLFDGKVEGINIPTDGYSSQKNAFDALRKKFGKPQYFNKINMQNGYGVHYFGYNAKWVIGDVIVTFAGVTSSTEFGEIKITTRKYDDLLNKTLGKEKDL